MGNVGFHLRRAADRLRDKSRAFRRAEDGAIIVLSLFLLVAMLLISGIAIDVVRTEQMRVKLQGTLDRSILAAASKTNTLEPKSVVLDYFTKAGLGQLISEDKVRVESDESFVAGVRNITFRSVEAVAWADVPTLFLNRVGIDQLPAPASGRADEGISPIEIVLVLDVSGSMREYDMTAQRVDSNYNPVYRWNGEPSLESNVRRIDALKRAAIRFVRTIYARPENQNRVAISIVPYAWNVNMGVAASSYGAPSPNAGSGCLVFDSDSDYQTPVITPSALHDRTPVADSFSSVSSSNTSGQSPVFDSFNWDCQLASNGYGNTGQLYTPFTNNVTVLEDAIKAMTHGGSTSIEVGMKWGTHLIDPSYQTVNMNMIAAGHTPSTFNQLPRSYGYAGTKKYIVLMTDGENMPSYTLNPEYRAGLSPIWEGTVSGSKRYSFQDVTRTSNQFFRASDSSWRSSPHGSSARQLTWPEVWDTLRVSWVAYHLYAKRTNPGNASWEYRRFYDNIRGNYAKEVTTVGDSSTIMTRLNSSDKDRRLQMMCDSVRTKKLVTVFTIRFDPNAQTIRNSTEAASAGAGDKAMANCASTYGHHYPATSGTKLQAAFDSIAVQILDLRLTQ